MKELLDKNVGQIVVEDYRSALVFRKYNIEFCCNGNRKLGEICKQEDLKQEEIVMEIDALRNIGNQEVTNYSAWSLDKLTDYIEKKHHGYVEERIPMINQYLNKICGVHGKRYPELLEIKELFHQCAGVLTLHMNKAELVLFPYIRKMARCLSKGEVIDQPNFGPVKNPVQMMMEENETAGNIFTQIAALSNNYTTPHDACGTYLAAFLMLKEFEEELHLHVHLENNILFPKAELLERELVIRMS